MSAKGPSTKGIMLLELIYHQDKTLKASRDCGGACCVRACTLDLLRKY